MDDTSFGYLFDQYRQIHQEPTRYRGRLQPYFVTQIAELVQKYEAETLLDYGSGKGEQYTKHNQHEAWGGLMPHCYDPGYLPFSKKPSTIFNGVICTDVAEHIPTEHVAWFLRDVISYADFFTFFCIFTDEAKARLPDGRNAHLTVQPVEWWQQKLVEAVKNLYSGKIEVLVLDQHTVIKTKGMEVRVVYRSKNKKDWV